MPAIVGIPSLQMTSVSERIVAAAAALISSQGLRATSIDDIAATAGCGRATVYRYFPGGRAELLDVTLGQGVDRIFALCTRVTDHAETLSEAVAATINIAVVEIANDGVVQQLLLDEPDTITTLISPVRIEPLIDRASEWGAEHFSRFVAPNVATYIGGWCVRVVTDHLRSPDPIIDITDLALASTLVDTFLLPTLHNSTQEHSSGRSTTRSY
ncbi:MAG: TetR/AcrR family transcriptional regulator [Acidimicrobiales bacterium]